MSWPGESRTYSVPGVMQPLEKILHSPALPDFFWKPQNFPTLCAVQYPGLRRLSNSGPWYPEDGHPRCGDGIKVKTQSLKILYAVRHLCIPVDYL